MKFYDELKYRGLIESVTSPEVEEKLNNGGLNFYIGTDPTADSLHIGHFMSVILMPERLKRAGHNPTILIGGGTGLIGDPKLTGERDIIKKETVSKNIVGLKKQIEGKFGFNTVNNNTISVISSKIDNAAKTSLLTPFLVAAFFSNVCSLPMVIPSFYLFVAYTIVVIYPV